MANFEMVHIHSITHTKTKQLHPFTRSANIFKSLLTRFKQALSLSPISLQQPTVLFAKPFLWVITIEQMQWLSMCYDLSYDPGSIELLQSKAVSVMTSWQSADNAIDKRVERQSV